MSKLSKNVLDLPMHLRALMALREAAESAMEEHIRWNLPMHFWKDGKVVEVPVAEVQKMLAERIAKREKSEITE